MAMNAFGFSKHRSFDVSRLRLSLFPNIGSAQSPTFGFSPSSSNTDVPEQLHTPSPCSALLKELLLAILCPQRLRFKSCDHQDHAYINRHVLSRFRKSALTFDDLLTLMQSFWCRSCKDSYVQAIVDHTALSWRVRELTTYILGEDATAQFLAISYTVALSCFHDKLRNALVEHGVDTALESLGPLTPSWGITRRRFIVPAINEARCALQPDNACHKIGQDLFEIPWTSGTKVLQTLVRLFKHLSSEHTRSLTALSFIVRSGSDLSFWVSALPQSYRVPTQKLVLSIWDRVARTLHPLEYAILGIFLPTFYDRFKTPNPATSAVQDGLWQNLWVPLLKSRLQYPELFQDGSRLKSARFVAPFSTLFAQARYPLSLYECISSARWNELRKLDGRPKKIADRQRFYDAIFRPGDESAVCDWIAGVIADSTTLRSSASQASFLSVASSRVSDGDAPRWSLATEHGPTSLFSFEDYDPFASTLGSIISN